MNKTERQLLQGVAEAVNAFGTMQIETTKAFLSSFDQVASSIKVRDRLAAIKDEQQAAEFRAEIEYLDAQHAPRIAEARQNMLDALSRIETAQEVLEAALEQWRVETQE